MPILEDVLGGIAFLVADLVKIGRKLKEIGKGIAKV
jgi:hypothetical protein